MRARGYNAKVRAGSGRTIGAVAERLKAAVLKTAVSKGTGGSNPSCSVGAEQHNCLCCERDSKGL